MTVIFLDIDGTLCDYQGNTPDSAVQAIQTARAKGHLVYLCTGRSRAEVYDSLWDIGVDGLIGGNGSYTEHRGQVLSHQLISAEDSHSIVHWLQEKGLEFFLESNNGLFASTNFEEAATPVIREYAAGKGTSGAATMTVRDAFPEMIFGGELYRADLNKISFILSTYQDYQDAATTFSHLKAGTWGGKGESALFGDLSPAGISKAQAMDVVLEHLGLTPGDSVAFGDATIDIPMLEHARVGVAMGNAGAQTIAAADLVTDTVENDGLYTAFEKLGLL